MSKITVDIGDLCTHCGKDTAFGSGDLVWVDRCPSDYDAKLVFADKEFDVTIQGYLCVSCRSMDCDLCGVSVLDDYILDGRVICLDCANKEGIEV